MKLDDDYFENREMGDPLPEGMDPDDYYRQAKAHVLRILEQLPKSPEEILLHASQQPRRPGRPKRDGKATIIELHTQNPPDVRRDRYDKRADTRGHMMFELAVAKRLQEYAGARILTNKFVGIDSHFKGRKLRRIHCAYKYVDLSDEVLHPLMEAFLVEIELPPVEIALKNKRDYDNKR